MKNIFKFIFIFQMSETETKTMEIIHEMLDQRGYKIEEEDDEKIIAVLDKKYIYVFKQIIDTFNIKRVKQITSILDHLDIKHCIVIYTDSATPAAKKSVKILSVNIQLELFTDKELQYNVTKHKLVPTHIKLSDEDINIYKRNYGTKLPIILTTDAVSRFYNYKKGNIIKIVRKNGYVIYRIVK